MAQTVGDLFKNFEAYIYKYIGDDNLLTKKVLGHSWQEEMERGLLEDIPWYSTRKKKPDNGLLPINHMSIICLADKGHRVRQFARKQFTSFRQKKEDCERMPMDAKHLKINLSYAIRAKCHA